MADTKQTPNQTMQHENAKGSVAGNDDRQREQGGFSPDRRPEQGGLNKDRDTKGEVGGDKNREKSAIGGAESRSQTGEPGRARSELDQNRQEPAGGKQR